MDGLLEKLDMDNELIVESMNDAKILINKNTAQWIAVSTKEYEKYLRVKEEKSYECDSTTKEVILKLLVNGIINFKDNSSKDEKMDNLKTKMKVYYAPTPYCNLNCVYCYAEAEKKFYTSMDDIKLSRAILDKIYDDSRVSAFVFTGGEPLLRKDIFDLAKYVFDKKKIKPSILTNGILVNKENVKEMHSFSSVTLSLDGHNAEIHEKTRGENTFEPVIAAIKLLQSEDIPIRVTTVISKTNHMYIEEILDFVKNELGINEHNISTHISHGRGKDSMIECTCDEVLDFRKKYFEYSLCNKNGEIISLIQPNVEKGRLHCMCGAGHSEIFVNYKGDVFPCRLLEDESYKLGNILEQPLQGLLDSAKMKNLDTIMNVDNIDSCRTCSYKYICGGGCRSSHACYTGSLSKSHDNLCSIIKNDLKCSIIMDCGYDPIRKNRLKEE